MQIYHWDQDKETANCADSNGICAGSQKRCIWSYVPLRVGTEKTDLAPSLNEIRPRNYLGYTVVSYVPLRVGTEKTDLAPSLNEITNCADSNGICAGSQKRCIWEGARSLMTVYPGVELPGLHGGVFSFFVRTNIAESYVPLRVGTEKTDMAPSLNEISAHKWLLNHHLTITIRDKGPRALNQNSARMVYFSLYSAMLVRTKKLNTPPCSPGNSTPGYTKDLQDKILPLLFAPWTLSPDLNPRAFGPDTQTGGWASNSAIEAPGLYESRKLRRINQPA
ncbi:hypothetical protein PROFUN_11730 [Planoprotostelium fungivorum]|uniref:Uncharacterized protein n=1 Tax=Planoprotostelium fungivorum TaxID=1890364 RepID=A0A2P6MYE0_9EUKA|nr:hypothetical protein PROFUN_11730 [Planoprotostelium fungivorum]